MADLTTKEAQQLQAWNDTYRDYPLDTMLLHQLFEEQAQRTPNAIAVTYEQSRLTYHQLDELANQLAHHLQSMGVGPETLVGISVDRSLEMVIGLYGILKAGGAYLPLDPTYPAERIAYMLKNAQAPILLTQAHLVDKLPPHNAQLIRLDSDWPQIDRNPTHKPVVTLTPDNLAYVIYTSGSTGRPKGVMNEHRGIVNRLLWMQEAYPLDETDCILQKTPFSFDVSVWEFFWPLMFGARLAVAKPEGHKDAAYLVDIIAAEHVTTLHFVPSMLHIFLDEPDVARSNETLRRVICSGEALSLALKERYFSHLNAPLYNLYGPTEAAVDVTHYTCQTESDLDLVPIGKPIANTQIHILDDQLQPQPPGTAGELHIGGVNVARGYLNRPELTAEKFIPDPFTESPAYETAIGPRLYKTGDLARYLPDGNIEYLGRLDYQVKIRGFRIELGEIETGLRQHPAIHEAVVIDREDTPGDKRLVAYLQPDPETAFNLWQLTHAGSKFTRHELPNGVEIICQNSTETEFAFREIFTDVAYLQHGLTLPPDACVFDVGANIGLFSMFALQQAPQGHIIAFEPIPPVFEMLQLNSSLYSSERTTLYQAGLASTPQEATFTYYPHVSILSGRFANPEEERALVKSFIQHQQGNEDLSEEMLDELLTERLVQEQVTCPLLTISQVIAEQQIERIDLLKIDVEKSELDVLRGIDAADWPKIQQIVVEVHDHDDNLAQVRNLLTEHGFRFTVEQDATLETTNLYNLYASRAPQNEAEPPPATLEPPLQWPNQRHLFAELRQFLGESLPDYMIPAAFVLLPKMPLTPNGKLDRKALPPPQQAVTRSYTKPRTHVEELLTTIWQETLNLPRVGIEENFFELGGHSLLAAQIVARLRQHYQLELTPIALFERPTIVQLARLIDPQHSATPPTEQISINKTERQASYPLTHTQQNMWFFQQLDPDSPTYNIPLALELEGPLDLPALERSLQQVVARHEALRTSFTVDATDNQPRQQITPHLTPTIKLVDLSDLPKIDQQQQSERHIDEAARHPFSLSQPPLLRLTLLRLAPESHLLLLTVHHIVVDGWSVGLLLQELFQRYQAQLTRETLSMATEETLLQQVDFVAWQRTQDFTPQLDYWQHQLTNVDLTPYSWPFDPPRPALRTFHGEIQTFTLKRTLSNRLQQLSQHHGVTLFMTLLAAFNVLLKRYTGQTDLLVAAPFANRHRPELEPVIGLLMNTLPLRINLADDPTFAALLEQVRQTVVAVSAQQEAPFEQVRDLPHSEEQIPLLSRDLQRTPLFQTVFIFQNIPVLEQTLFADHQHGPTLHINQRITHSHTAKVDLTLEMYQKRGKLHGWFEYNSGLFSAETISHMIDHFQTVLTALITEPKQPISALPLLTPTEREKMLVTWNDTRQPYPELQQSLVALFEAQVERTPQAVAFRMADEQLTYESLNEQANQIAHRLAALGADSQTVVGLCMARSLEMITAFYGILKAGAIYLPLDPAYPQPHLAFIIEDAQAPFILTETQFIERLPQDGPKLLDLTMTAAQQPAIDPQIYPAPNDPAYMIYTSGSTGQPKGVIIPHRQILNRMAWMWTEYPFAPHEVSCQKTALNFVDSLWELLGPALQSSPTVIIPDEQLKDPAAFITALSEHGVTRLWLVPSLLRLLLDTFPDLQQRLPQLKFWVTSGEAIPAALFARFEAAMPHATLYNLYGTSEVWDVTWYVPHEQFRELARVPIGYPIANMECYILDEAQNPQPIGVAGLLHVGGLGLAEGYLNRPELTAEKFIPHPFSEAAGARLYNSGDLARYLPDGNIEYIGRGDFQIKLRGYRIELGEIEVTLTQHAAIKQTVAVLRADSAGEKRLVAYVVPKAEQTISQTELFEFVSQRLPAHMVPNIFMVMEALPLTPNGKINRRALPTPDPVRPDAANFVPPDGPVEEMLATVWQTVLNLERVGVHDNFFQLGGHSLLATQVISRLSQEYDVEIPLRLLFEKPTIAQLAPEIEEMLLAELEP